MTNLLAQAQAATAKLADQTADVASGPREYTPPAAGPCIARFVSYVEVGTHPQRAFKGEEKPPAAEAIFEFELMGKKHAKEITLKDGTAKTIFPILRQRLAIKQGSKANFVKLIKAMDYGRGNTHAAMMLGEAFIINVIHREANGKTFANMKDASGSWTISAPVRVDEEGETQAIKAPEATNDMKLLLWDAPSIEQWDSLKGRGDKSWMQDLIQEALNFKGSALESVLEIPADEVDIEAPAKSAPAAEPMEFPADDAEDDPLAELGL